MLDVYHSAWWIADTKQMSLREVCKDHLLMMALTASLSLSNTPFSISGISLAHNKWVFGSSISSENVVHWGQNAFERDMCAGPLF